MEDTSDISTKNILVEYLKLSDKHDMANAVEKYCDDISGIVFNKHPATNEKKFSDILDYAASTYGNSKISASSFVYNGLNTLETLSDDNNKEYKSFNNCNISESSYKPAKCVLRSDKSNKSCTNSFEQSMKKKSYNHNKKCTIFNNNEENSNYELITPEGPGTFLKFIGENYVYIQIKDGGKHCFPLELIEYNINYLKKHPLHPINLNYKNMALNHTINILNGKNTDINQIKMGPSKDPKDTNDQFVNFNDEMQYLKYVIPQNEPKEKNEKKDYQIHLFAKQMELEYPTKDILSRMHPSCNAIKKNIYVHSLKNEYKLQKVTPYDLIGEGVLVDDENSQNKLCC